MWLRTIFAKKKPRKNRRQDLADADWTCTYNDWVSESEGCTGIYQTEVLLIISRTAGTVEVSKFFIIMAHVRF